MILYLLYRFKVLTGCATIGLMIKVLLITGPSGSGKSTIAFELSAILRKNKVSHGLIDSDELDRLYPIPIDQEDLVSENLRAVWEGFAKHGCNRLVLCGVFADLQSDMNWIKRALPESTEFQPFRLQASASVIHDRLGRREIGSLLDEHLTSSAKASDYIHKADDGALSIDTNNRKVSEIARDILSHTDWLDKIV